MTTRRKQKADGTVQARHSRRWYPTLTYSDVGNVANPHAFTHPPPTDFSVSASSVQTDETVKFILKGQI